MPIFKFLALIEIFSEECVVCHNFGGKISIMAS